jgi:hypothetical protein
MTEITPGVLRDWQLEVAAYADGVEPTTWTRVGGLTEFTPPVYEKNQEDDSSYDSDGDGSVIGTGRSWKIEGTVKVARASLTQDPGQVIIKTAGESLLEDGFVHVRIVNVTKPTEGRTGIADATYTPNGGPHTDLTTAGFELVGRGSLAPVTITP